MRPAVAVAVGVQAVAADFAVVALVAETFLYLHLAESQPPHNLPYRPRRAFMAVQFIRPLNQLAFGVVAFGQPVTVYAQDAAAFGQQFEMVGRHQVP